jgi:hypothetical protein
MLPARLAACGSQHASGYWRPPGAACRFLPLATKARACARTEMRSCARTAAATMARWVLARHPCGLTFPPAAHDEFGAGARLRARRVVLGGPGSAALLSALARRTEPATGQGASPCANEERQAQRCSSSLHIAAPTGSLASAKSMTLHPVSTSPLFTPDMGHAGSRPHPGSSAPSSLRAP